MGAWVRLATAGAVVAVIATAPRARASSGDRALPGLYVAGRALPPVASSIDVRVEGPFAEATVTQRFRNPLDRPIEAVYIFPLPDDAAVSAMVIHAGSRTITARIEDRAGARSRYEAAVAAGATAALLEEERADVFTQQVTAIPPGAEVSVELRFDAPIVRRAGAWELALPLVVAPRVAPGSPTGAPSAGTGSSPDTSRAPDASRVTPETGGDGVPVAIRARLDAGVGAGAVIDSVEVPTHDAIVQLHGRTADVAIKDARGDHDVVIRWRTRGDALAAITDAAGFVAVMVPAPAAAPLPPRDWIVVADTSRRASGDDAILVRRAVRALLDRVGPHDRVAIYGAGGARAVALGGGRAAARAWTDAVSTDSAGDLSRGLVAARAAAKAARRPAIVLVSDGLVADDAELDDAVAGGPPLFAIGVGAAPNRGLLDRLASRTGGGARYLGAADDPGATAGALIAQADGARPAATSPEAAIEWGGLVTDALPAIVPAMAPGDAVVVVAKVDQPRRARVAVAARALDLPAVWSAATDRPDEVAKASVVARRWARAKVDALLAAGASAADVRALGLRYGLVTPETALVAVGTDVVVKGGVTTSVSIPVPLPAGMKWQAVDRATQEARDEGGAAGGDALAKNQTTVDEGKHGGKTTDQPADHTADKSGEAANEKVPEKTKETGKAEDDRDRAREHAGRGATPTTGATDTGATTIVVTKPGYKTTNGTAPAPAPAEPSTQNVPTTPAPTANPSAGATSGESAVVPPPERAAAAEDELVVTGEQVELSSEAIVIAPRRWGVALTLGAGALVAPSRDPLGLASVRVERGLDWRTAVGLDVTVLGAPTADRDRVAVALMAALVRGGLFRGRLTLDLGLGAELASDPGLAYQLGARFGLRGRTGLVLRWDGAVLFGDSTIQRGSATAGVQVDF